MSYTPFAIPEWHGRAAADASAARYSVNIGITPAMGQFNAHVPSHTLKR